MAVINLAAASVGISTSSLQRELLILLLSSQNKALATPTPTQAAHMKTQADRLSASWPQTVQVQDKDSPILLDGRFMCPRMNQLTRADDL